ncbi:MAG: hypothetical protein KDK70_29395, partial [Myxococcales bacterium]|nr:hypothetical protein [Myxococcales bacterium]
MGRMLVRARAGALLATGALASACPTDTPTMVTSGSTGGSTTLGAPDPTTADGSTTLGPGDDSTGADALPPTPALLSPADGAVDLSPQTTLCWVPVLDPDGDAVRYRVFVDDIELTQGVQGTMEGVDGPCLGPLQFDDEQTYQWQVQAFEVDDPARQSARSEAWSFTIAGD